MILEVSWDGLWTLLFGLSRFHGHGSWFVCEVSLNTIKRCTYFFHHLSKFNFTKSLHHGTSSNMSRSVGVDNNSSAVRICCWLIAYLPCLKRSLLYFIYTIYGCNNVPHDGFRYVGIGSCWHFIYLKFKEWIINES